MKSLLSINFNNLSAEGYAAFILAIIFTIVTIAATIYYLRHKDAGKLTAVLAGIVFPVISVFCWCYLLCVIFSYNLAVSLGIAFGCAAGYALIACAVGLIVIAIKNHIENKAEEQETAGVVENTEENVEESVEEKTEEAEEQPEEEGVEENVEENVEEEQEETTEVEEAVIIKNIPIEIKNNKIYVPNDSISLEHQLFFDRFLTREKDSNYIIYDLSFKNIAKAVDLGITLEEILNYLQDNAEDMPNALIDKFKYYETILNKVKIKEVTVLEFSNDLKIKINNNQKLKKFILADNNNEFVIIKEKNAKEVKKVIENDELFCLIDK